MTTIYYSGNLPQTASIIPDLNANHTYCLPKSKILCFPFMMKANYYQVIIDMADTTPFESSFIPGARAWPSIEPAGQSITKTPNSLESSINLMPNGHTWNFWLQDLHNHPLIPTAINHQILGK